MSSSGPIGHGGRSGASLGGHIVGRRRKKRKDYGVPEVGPVTVTLASGKVVLQDAMSKGEAEKVIRKGERTHRRSGGRLRDPG